MVDKRSNSEEEQKKETIKEPEAEYTVEYEVYQVSEVKEWVGDTEWYEYIVKLLKDGMLIDRWDSRIETYPIGNSQRLSEHSARRAAKTIKEEVEETQDPSLWFGDYDQ